MPLSAKRLHGIVCLFDPVNAVDAIGLRTVIITTHDYGIGSHSAVYVDNSGNGDPAIYDPAGSYGDRQAIGSGDLITGPEANLHQYGQYHLDAGSRVTFQYFDTTPNEEAAIYKKAEEQGGAFPLFCTMATSSAIDGIGPFRDLGMKYFPDQLRWSLEELQRQREIEQQQNNQNRYNCQ